MKVSFSWIRASKLKKNQSTFVVNSSELCVVIPFYGFSPCYSAPFSVFFIHLKVVLYFLEIILCLRSVSLYLNLVVLYLLYVTLGTFLCLVLFGCCMRVALLLFLVYFCDKTRGPLSPRDSGPLPHIPIRNHFMVHRQNSIDN